MVDVVKELETLRQNLLDLSLRNNLLNYRPSPRRTISITGRTPEEVYDLFVLQEKSMKFRATKARSRKGKKAENGEEDAEESESRLLKTIGKILTSEERNKTSNSRFEPFLETPDDSETLDRKLFYVYNQANSIFEEQGYPVLYLAMGFLQWSETKSSVKNPRAPLVLVPVELKRIGKGRNFSIQWTGDEVFTSITLQARMKEFGIEVPEFEMPEEASGIQEYFRTVLAAIREKPEWKVIPEVCLDLFNFRKFVMYKDMDPATWPEDMSPAEHPLIQKVFNPQEPDCEVQGFREEEVDLKLTAKDTYHIMDADSSQIAVVEDVKAGKDLVVEGPPGTGKSQTIANTIAELLAQGKSVLFVSEKMAALQVVKSRLDNAGLGELCLEVHSHQTRKKAVLEELEKALKREAPPAISAERDLNELEKLKQELNRYAEILREPAGKIYPSLYSLYGVKEKNRIYFESKGMKMPRFKFQDPDTWESSAWAEAESILEKMGQVLPALGPVRKNTWYGCEPGLVLPSDLGEIGAVADECAFAFENLEKSIKTLNDISATAKPQALRDIFGITEAAKLVGKSKPLPEKLLQNPEWDSEALTSEAEALVSKVRQYRELKTFVDKTFHPSIFDLEASEFKELSGKLLSIFNSRYRKLKKEISACYVSGAPSKDSRILLDLACVSECKAHRAELEGAEISGKKFFSEYWKGFESDPILLGDYCKWMVPFRRHIKDGILTDRSVRLVGSGVDAASIESAVNEVMATKEAFILSLEKLGTLIGADFEKMFGDIEAVKLSQLKTRVTKWKDETSSLVFWSQYLGYRQACLETLASPMLDDIEAGKIEPEDMIPAFEGNYAESMLHRAFRERPDLSAFIRELHEGKISKFIDLDKKVLLENRTRIVCTAYEVAPKLTSGASRASEAGILLNEFNRKRGHMPIRTLMKKAGSLIQRIKPCFLMSPLSIAQYLDPRSTRFDVIIFDEASQVRPEDAVGALLRGKQVVVMGDSKQLPPTDFFDTVVDSHENEPEDYTPAGDMESILNVCKRSFPVKTLRWHYRSRHESLIAISNQEFYDNRLYVYPSPMQKDESLGLKFVHLPDAAYDRGRSGANRIEARAVARAVFEHFQKYPGKSLGVGTFNIKQQEAIQEEIEALLKANPGVDLNSGNDRGEHFFVKNLETIQGDERDVILLSVGYGFDSNRKLSLNFGPLNRDGGERRLNVLITRAREKCIVFSNFTSRDLPLDENSPFGLKALKVFLEFAESGTLPSPSCGRKELDSPFEEAVSDFLAENGCEVHRQIGCAGYRLDLAVPDPLHPGRYVLGIECDGADYHSSTVARDRDRLRQQVLEGLGWKIYRVWSTDWYLHPRECREKLLETVKENVKQAKMQAKSEPEPERININEPSAWAKTVKDYEINVSPDASLFLPLESGVSEEPEVKTFETSSLSKTSSGTDILSENILENSPFVRKVQVEFSPKKKSISKTPLEAADEEEVEETHEEEPEDDGKFEEAGDEESYQNVFGLEKGLSSSSGVDFLPEMTLKAESMAKLADENSRNMPARRAKKSKLLKFSADPRSDFETDREEESYLIPEPEPEKINFFQAYPEIDFSAGPEKKRKSRKINEFAYIYGSGGYFEPEEPDEDDYPDLKWGPEPEITPEPEAGSENRAGLNSRAGSEIESEMKINMSGSNPQKELKSGPGSTLKANNSEIIESAAPGNAESGDEKLSGKGNSLEALVPPYRICLSSGLQQSADLSEISDAQLEDAVVEIVEFEGPIHSEEILQRIRSHTGLPRMLGKIRQRILDATAAAESSGKIQVRGEFCWPLSGPAYLLRRRDTEAYAKIEWICDEEIKEAVRFVLINQYSTPMEDLIIQTSRVLGIKTTRKNTWDRIEKLIQSGIERNELTRTPNEMIYFVE
jgi:superfamily I DNA and/or RNA helicase/very-short-patch-repair endonuclease